MSCGEWKGNMKCDYCGRRNKPDREYCRGCGAPLDMQGGEIQQAWQTWLGRIDPFDRQRIGRQMAQQGLYPRDILVERMLHETD